MMKPASASAAKAHRPVGKIAPTIPDNITPKPVSRAMVPDKP